ncbi:ascorbate peroxidase domain-containing protein [Phanerochaete sordida]|uniref:Peroxidase n=1 Tax=Phanerochaete sordida TaxID=48140 RepID=A0A9P3GD73_9APHY|nr:ascorbate peroxidase domain-containing protein [Phanerochaete sordida]
MSFAALRASVRRAAAPAPAALRRSAFRSSVRRYSTEPPPPSPPPPKSSNATLYGALGAAALGGVVFWIYTSSSDSAKSAGSAVRSGVQGAKAAANFTPTKEDYIKIYNKIAEVMDEAADKNYDDGSYGPIFFRLGWHSSGTYDKVSGTGGSNFATMRFAPESEHGANKGLNVARDLMEEIHKQFPWISYGDLWTLGAVTAIQEMGGPHVPWRPGRIDGFAAQATPDGRLPDGAKGADHLRVIFGRMGFDDREIVALSGGHAVGRCHHDRSGWDGPWTFSPVTISNSFYKLLLEETWVWKKWDGPKQLEDKGTRTLMMLPTDYALVTDKVFKKWTKAYADDEELFFKDFAGVCAKLFENGVPQHQWATSEPWIMPRTDEQEANKSK